MTGTSRRGFTLIELLIVVVIIAIIASIALPKFSSTKGKAYASSVKSDLRNVVRLQEHHYNEFATYSKSLAVLGMQVSQGVILTIMEADGKGWSAHGIHSAANPLECAVFIGGAAPVPPATQEGIVTCN